MKLKKLRIDGFKSFADKVEFDFKSPITAIVGPNGSGKSNIVDAIRWVLGEQSLKSLRGGKEMCDVIFKGSETRKPLKRASVALEFDNQEHFLNTNFETVEVKRVLYHTGESEYYLNNAKVRLKDIYDLFLDSGIGNNSLNIITQGAVEKIITAKPIERRIIIEGSSKVLKYKTRKAESLKKLASASDNLEKVDLIINELKYNLEPLEKQSKEAKEYLEIIKNYEDLDKALTTKDIQKHYDNIENIKNKKQELNNQKLVLETTNNSDIEKLKLNNLQIDEELEKLNKQYNLISEQLSEVLSEKTILLERSKYTIDSSKVDEAFLALTEKKNNYIKKLQLNQNNLQTKKETKTNIQNELDKLNNDLMLKENKKRNLDIVYQNKIREEVETENKIKILKNAIEMGQSIPNAVKNVLHNPRLNGICGTIGQLSNVKNEYSKAIDVALASAQNFVVTKTTEDAKVAINYLKESHLGRVTFFPINVIKPRKLPDDVLKTIQQKKGFVSIASDIVSCASEYKNIIENQLGNVIIAKDLDSMQTIAKEYNYAYKIVTLDGEINHVGGSLTGGNIKTTSTLNDQLELENKEKQLKIIANDKEKITKEITAINDEIQKMQKERQNYQDQDYTNEKIINDLTSEINALTKDIENIELEMKRTNTLLKGNQEKEISSLLTKEQELSVQKELINAQIDEIKTKKQDVITKIEEEEHNYKQKSSELHNLINEINSLEIEKNKSEMKMDALLNHLNEDYHITYEKAKENFILDIEEQLAKENLINLKRELQKYSNVNLGSIDEYERISSRYEFLNTQKNDLTTAINELNQIIEEMDEKMIERLTTTFEQIEKEFSLIFKEIFKGGKGMLKLTEPDNILESGIEIIAEPPGKKLGSISLLSGGEKTLTAIALLFSILNVFPVPFCVLDEVEAALDEANVDTFGKYLQTNKAKSQYLLITHKKRTMEYADTLYGITMQEQGVSKIVGVKLQ